MSHLSPSEWIPCSFRHRQEPDDLADENMYGHLVDHPAPIFPKPKSVPATSRVKTGSTFTIEQGCKMVNTRPTTQLKHNHRNFYGIVAPIKIQATAYRQW